MKLDLLKRIWVVLACAKGCSARWLLLACHANADKNMGLCAIRILVSNCNDCKAAFYEKARPNNDCIQWPNPLFSPLSSSKTHLFSRYLTDTLLPASFQSYPSHSLSNDDVEYECATALKGEEHLVRGLGKGAPHSYTHHYPCKHSLYRWTLWKHMHTPYCQIIYILLSISLVKLSFASQMNL